VPDDTACAEIEGNGCAGLVSAPPSPKCTGDSIPSDTGGDTGVGALVGGCRGVPAACGCQSATGGVSWMLLLLLITLVRRGSRAIGLVLLAGFLAPHAWAGVDAQAMQTLDGGTFPVLREADAGGAWEPAGAVSVSFARGLVTWVGPGDQRVDLLDQVLTTELSGSLRVAELARFGVSVPTHHLVRWEGQPVGEPVGSFNDRAVWGDAAVWGMVPILRDTHGLDLAWYTQVDLPTGTPAYYLGDVHPGVHALGAVGYQFGGWEALANLGVRIATVTELPGIDWGSRWEYGLGLHRALFGRVVANVEVFGSASVQPTSAPGDVPIEVTGTLGWEIAHGLVVHAGGGGGLTTGIGSPEMRVLVMLDWRRRAYRDRDGDTIIDPKDRCPDDPEDFDGLADTDGCPETDLDGDGILDLVDACPKNAETMNGYHDTDGCPDLVSELAVTVSSAAADVPLDHATLTIGELPPMGALADEPAEVAIPPGTVLVHAEADGFHPFDAHVEIPPGPFAYTIRLEPRRFGDVHLRLVDAAGRPLAGYLRHAAPPPQTDALGEPVPASAERAPLEMVPAEGRVLTLPTGDTTLTVRAPGYSPRTIPVSVPGDHPLDLVVTLAPSDLRIVGSRIETTEQVHFPLDSAEIPDGAEGPLDDLAALLLGDPRIELLRIEGHADERGTSRYNLDLSRRRAEAIRAWLVAAGVPPERLVAIGTGEARPAAEGETASRRVEFLVLVWADEDGDGGAAPTPPPSPAPTRGP
jgi:outer membrane protein OmpA-like peptidoglycan-associated protein